MRSQTATARWARRPGRLPALLLLVLAELVALSLAYQHGFTFTCRAQAPDWFCAFAGRLVPRAVGVLAALGLFALARRASLGALTPPRLLRPLALNLSGLALALAPWLVLSDASGPGLTGLALLSWSAGGMLGALGLALGLAPAAVWAGLARRHGAALAGLTALGLAAPELADLLQPLWRIDAVTEATFAAVVRTLGALGYPVLTLPAEKLIGTPDFVIAVGAQCAGLEGAVLITLFVSLYLLLFRGELRFPQVLLLYPLGLLLSWGANVLRIATLLVIGLEGHPELAIGGFHSHAGWAAFTALSLLLILAARHVPAFRQAPPSGRHTPALPPFRSDPQVARLLPFAVMMASALGVSTVSAAPALLYPWRALAMAAALAFVLPGLRGLALRAEPRALALGAAIAALWIATAPASGAGPTPPELLAGPALALWLVTRTLGSTLLVPVIEELFFRDYLLRLLSRWPLAAATLSTLAFAALHDRWIVAALAGLALCRLRLRSGGIAAPIAAHAAANGVIAAWAWTTGGWHIL